jgi:hypothetical protein
MDSGDQIRSEVWAASVESRTSGWRQILPPAGAPQRPGQGNPPSDPAVRSNYFAGFVRRLPDIAGGARTYDSHSNCRRWSSVSFGASGP